MEQGQIKYSEIFLRNVALNFRSSLWSDEYNSDLTLYSLSPHFFFLNTNQTTRMKTTPMPAINTIAVWTDMFTKDWLN